jgi:hypothetical protein
MKQAVSNVVIVLDAGIIAVVVGAFMQNAAGETAPIGLALGVMLVVGGLLGRR